MNPGKLTIDVDTTAFIKKLRAISKHANALVKELEIIDASVCHECGSRDVEVSKVHGSNKTFFTHFHCRHCGARWND